jgi:hypothetical protein
LVFESINLDAHFCRKKYFFSKCLQVIKKVISLQPFSSEKMGKRERRKFFDKIEASLAEANAPN